MKKLKELYWTKDGFKPFPNLFVWLITAILIGWLVNSI